MIHDRTKAVAPPKFPFAVNYPPPMHATRRQELAAWLTSPANPYFAKSYVNRLWGYLLGAGIIEPLDDIRAGNPPSNPELLDYLTREFIGHQFDVRHVLRLICRSRTYQLSLDVNRWNSDDRTNYSHAIARRLPAEVLYDAIHRVTGSTSRIPGVPAGTRAEALPDAGVRSPDGFLANLGRPARESVCECERSSGLQLGSVMALISGPTVEAAISDDAQRTGEAGGEREGRLQTGRRDFPSRAQSAGDSQGDRSRPGRTAAIAGGAQATGGAIWRPSRRNQRRPASRWNSSGREAIAEAKQALAAYEKQIAPQVAAQMREHDKQIAAAEAALREAEKTLPQRHGRLGTSGQEGAPRGRPCWRRRSLHPTTPN